MPCTKDTLVLRLKKLRKEKSEDRLREPFAALVLLVTKGMSSQTARWEQLREQYEKRQKEFTEKSATDPNLKKPRQPGKIFSWDVDTKEAFTKLIQIKMESYAISRPRGVTQEDWMKQYLDEEVKGVWPTGWMTVKNLEKSVKPILSGPVLTTGTNGTNATTSSPPSIKAPSVPAGNGAGQTVGQKRKLSDQTAQQATVPKKKSPKETTPSTPYTIKDLTVKLVPAQIPPGTVTPTMKTTPPVRTPPPMTNSKLKTSTPPPLPPPVLTPKTLPASNDPAIVRELEKLKHLKQIIHGKPSPKEGGRSSSSMPVDKRMDTSSSSVAMVESARCGVIKSPPPRTPPPPLRHAAPSYSHHAHNFSVSQLTSPVKSEHSAPPHIPVIINNHKANAGGVVLEVKPTICDKTQRVMQRCTSAGYQFQQSQPQSISPMSASSASSFCSTSSSLPSSTCVPSVSQSASHSVSKMFEISNSVSASDLLFTAAQLHQSTASSVRRMSDSSQGMFMSPPSLSSVHHRPKQQQKSSPVKNYPIYNPQLVSSPNWQIGSTNSTNQKVCMVKMNDLNVVNMPHQSNTLYAVPISNSQPIHQQSPVQQAALSADLNAIEPTLPIDSNLLYKQHHLATQVSSSTMH